MALLDTQWRCWPIRPRATSSRWHGAEAQCSTRTLRSPYQVFPCRTAPSHRLRNDKRSSSRPLVARSARPRLQRKSAHPMRVRVVNRATLIPPLMELTAKISRADLLASSSRGVSGLTDQYSGKKNDGSADPRCWRARCASTVEPMRQGRRDPGGARRSKPTINGVRTGPPTVLRRLACASIRRNCLRDDRDLRPPPLRRNQNSHVNLPFGCVILKRCRTVCRRMRDRS